MYDSYEIQSFGQFLINRGLVTPEEREYVRNEYQNSNKSMMDLFIENKFVSKTDIYRALSEYTGLEYVSLQNIKPETAAIALVPETTATRLRAFPLKLSPKGALKVAVDNPFNSTAFDELRVLSQKPVDLCIATEEDIKSAISTYYKVRSNLNDALNEITNKTLFNTNTKVEAISKADTSDAPVIRLCDSIFENAVHEGASDIHVEPMEDKVRIRFRIDGVLYVKLEFPRPLLSAFVTRIKILSNMNIAEKRKPQDGRIITSVSGHNIDMRVSSIPSIWGEKLVMRILDQTERDISLESLGYSSEQIELISKIIHEPNGIFLVTGPTGSGKSTTLYAMFKMLNSDEYNLVTIEDPVEYTIKGVTQVQVNEKIGVSFTNILRTILRQDPDKIMLGEIRDSETAQLALQSALTGHFLFSTLHTNDAPSAITRLIDLNAPKYIIASSLRGVVAQRLLRKLCPHCRQSYKATLEIEAEWGIPTGTKLYRAKGCSECRYTGYIGRIPIAEIMPVDNELRHMIETGALENDIREYMKKNKFTSLHTSAMKKVLLGETTLEEMIITTMNL